MPPYRRCSRWGGRGRWRTSCVGPTEASELAPCPEEEDKEAKVNREHRGARVAKEYGERDKRYGIWEVKRKTEKNVQGRGGDTGEE